MPVPPQNVHPVKTEGVSLDEAAQDYEAMLKGLYGADTLFSYTAAKSALFGMTRSLARDWERYRVTLN